MSDSRYIDIFNDEHADLPKTNNIGEFFKKKDIRALVKEVKNYHLFLKKDDEIVGLRNTENTTLPAFVYHNNDLDKNSPKE
jgi:hypothetical protein